MPRNMTYQEWEKWKKSENPEAWDAYIKKSKNYSSDQKQYDEYKKLLGENIPDSFAKFQDMKYNEPVKWDLLKEQKKETVFINNAPCSTTSRKFSGFFLKPEAKHSKDFFDVGYTKDDALRLRYDMAKQFDIEKATDFKLLDSGAEKFSVFMDLGINDSKRFRTVWGKDTPESIPRIITAHRED